MLVQCPHCGGTVVVNGLGRKRLDITLEFILEAYQLCENNYSATARLLSGKLGQRITPGFVHGRIKEARGK